ncbi:MAG: PIG-L deacetylase family protein [Sphingomonadaceae bacterium]
MTDTSDSRRILVVAPHPDDEILGCGGTMARLANQGCQVHVLIVTTGKPPAYSAESVAQVRREMEAAHSIIGVTQTHELDFPAAGLASVPASELNSAVGEAISGIRPDTLYLPFIGDIHADHQHVFMAAMVAARPRHNNAPAQIYCYETLSETNWYAPPITQAFVPNCFADISSTLEQKLKAFSCFASQARPFPEERSPEAIEALARMRGATVHLKAAEAFMLVREIKR